MKGTSGVRNETFYKEYYNIKEVINRLKDLPKIESLRTDIKNNKDRKNIIDNNLQTISDDLKNIDEVEVYEEELQKNRKNVSELRDKNTKLASDITKLDNDIKKLQKEREENENLRGELKLLSDKIKFCEEVKGTINDLKNNVQKHIRSKVNDRIRQQFIGIDWQYGKYTDVTLEKNYQIKIKKNSGRNVTPSDLSDGEESLLALSFMMALHSLSGFEIPLIIDAPFEKLDKGKRIDFIKDLHSFTKDKQIVFLFTDSQYTDDVRANMIKNIMDEYELKPEEDKTEIVKHG